MPQDITEKDGVQKEWYAAAKKVANAGQLASFVGHLIADYNHDYGTICHACAAAGVAGVHCIDASPQGGITGFQAGAIMWEFIQAWGAMEDGPKRMICYADMLYPQYEDKFEKTISPDTWEYLQEQAKKLMAQDGQVHGEVRAHWHSIAKGKVPFGYLVEKES